MSGPRSAGGTPAADGAGGAGGGGAPDAPDLARDVLEIVYRPLDELIPYARNARTHSEAQLAKIRASMLEWGWTNPVLLDGANMILAGHGRVMEAANIWRDGGTIKRTKPGMVPCLDLHGMSEAQKRAYILADNKIAEDGGWDKALVAMEVEDLREMGYEVKLTGFEDDDLARAAGKSSGVSSVDVHELTDRFWISIRGPMKHQAKALKALREACAGIGNVEVELGTIDGM